MGEHQPMTDAELESIDHRAKLATGGLVEANAMEDMDWLDQYDLVIRGEAGRQTLIASMVPKADAEFFRLARVNVRRLVAEVRRLRAERSTNRTTKENPDA